MTSTAPEAAPVLRPMRWWDVDAVVALDRELFAADAWAPELFWAELATGGRSYLVAEDADGEVLGFAGLAVTGAESDVQTIGVAAGAQGTGLGSRLLDALIALAIEADVAWILLEVAEDNSAARRLYDARDFTVIARRAGYYQDGSAALIMRRALR